MSSPVLFVFGGTGNVGSALAKRFAKQGYKVALASRSAETGFRAEDGSLLVKLDVAQPSTISGAFETVKEHFGRTPSVVVYNAYANDNTADPLSLSIDRFTEALSINTVSAFAALKTSVENKRAGERLTFIFTGNLLNTARRVPNLLTLGIGKAASAHMLDTIVPLYKDQDVHLFYADERQANGNPMWNGVGGEAAAEHYFHLTTADADEPVLQTFVQGRGYVQFEKEVKVEM